MVAGPAFSSSTGNLCYNWSVLLIYCAVFRAKALVLDRARFPTEVYGQLSVVVAEPKVCNHIVTCIITIIQVRMWFIGSHGFVYKKHYFDGCRSERRVATACLLHN